MKDGLDFNEPQKGLLTMRIHTDWFKCVYPLKNNVLTPSPGLLAFQVIFEGLTNSLREYMLIQD